MSFLFDCSHSLSHWKSYPTSKESRTTTAVHWYHYCNITRPRVWRICSSRGCLQHSTLQAAGRAAPAAGLQICESVLRKIRTQLPGEENSAAAGRGFCSTAAVTAGHSWGSAAAGSWAAALQSVLQAQYLAPCTLQVEWIRGVYVRILYNEHIQTDRG